MWKKLRIILFTAAICMAMPLNAEAKGSSYTSRPASRPAPVINQRIQQNTTIIHQNSTTVSPSGGSGGGGFWSSFLGGAAGAAAGSVITDALKDDDKPSGAIQHPPITGTTPQEAK